MGKLIRKILEHVRDTFLRILFYRIFIIFLIFFVLYMTLIYRLFDLQIRNGEKYLREYEDRSLTEVTIPGARGNIYDRDGNLLAYNQLQYNITIVDGGYYDTSSEGINNRNTMLYDLAEIIEKYGYSIEGQYKIRLSEGEYIYTVSGDERNRFISNLRGKNIDDLSPEDFLITAEEAVGISTSRYHFDRLTDKNGKHVEIGKETLLDMINIFYTMRLTAYQRYQTTTIVKNVSRECKAEILESKGHLKGVDIENVSVRRYNYAPYMSHITGYTGQIREDALGELQEKDPSYQINDTVGVWGLEKSMETVLRGKNGVRKMYLNSLGSVMETVYEEEAGAGNDVYTTISANDQIAIYHLLEVELAGILSAKLTEDEDFDKSKVKQSEIRIPIQDAYYQLINNNVLDRKHFEESSAGSYEKKIYEAFLDNKKKSFDNIRRELLDQSGRNLTDLQKEQQAYMVYIFDYLTSKNSGLINTEKEAYRESEALRRWREDTISMREFIISGIEESWIDIAALDLEEDYYDMDNIYTLFSDKLLGILEKDEKFDNLLYKYAISDGVIKGSWLMEALLEEEKVPFDSESYETLRQGDEHEAFLYLKKLINSLQITPAQLALDPSSGAVTVVDVNTGKVKALVTYPGFDNNQISDYSYLQKCNADLSLPLLNCALQTQLAPGSTFKPITSVAALEEKVISGNTIITCTGKYEEVTPNIRCWIYPLRHNEENIVDGLKNSCNYFFADVGHLLSMDEEGNYSYDTGLEKIKKYASLFGLNETSGVELDEAAPRISDTDPERSAMGQGNHAYNNVQLARYITAVANGGTLYKLSVIDRIADSEGNIIEENTPETERVLPVSDTTWSLVKTGLRKMITEGVAKAVFLNQDIPVSGKTGTAQEREDRGNHSVFVSYAPSDSPEISVTVNIPYGYSSGNAANLANMVYNYCYGKTSLENVLSMDASGIGTVNVSD